MRYLTFKSILFILIGLTAPTIQADMKMEINDIIKVTDNKDMVELLKKFKQSHKDSDDIRVSEQTEKHYEFIVSHRSENGFTGGAEQYFLDKNTGKTTMGWHEHPMKMPVFTRSESEEPEPEGSPRNLE